ncbi:bifunctional alpha/beta hydrolase/OsmC family protein [Octadecabacter sp. 1_MG-2023]|uniref:bifunctional alpha/beta hydrolase/OsmC family protein n=1 Tax=unclassified Octadecabacter TaxID=196158 RepID=UPI001C0A60DB|nr:MULTISPECIES: bifunctional alpha/beta hydrolase/OsmC family protein [unclassified Octadecabacter]MBU2993733.1 bifunctional alpha/beta hydrolase/OsmC family protein [Octadecabacter sp. B2R22]MDO6735422.1 bifunctional alpha/beta hydrolase/OsmC family protein [Octadecabacter sp. 1_MG-2023]
MPTERFTFPGHDGGQLSARLDLPDGPHLATALFAHCFTCSKDIPAARRVAARLAGLGIAVLRFDFTGLGHSEGEFENTNFTTNVQDLVTACAELDKRNMTPSLLIGHSLGGAAVLKAAAQMDNIKAVATIGAPFDPEHVTHNFAHALPDILRDGIAEVSLGGRSFRISNDFLEDVAKGELTPAIASLNAALLVLHGPRDATVSIDNASEIFLAAKHPKSFVTLDNADHLLSNAEDAEYAADVIATWAARYLDLRRPAPPIGTPEGVLRVSEADPNGYLQDIHSGPHHVLADEPAAYGGSNKGLTPYGFLSAGLGACTSMTIRMYARRKGWPLDHVSVDVTHDKVHGQDAGAETKAKIDRFVRTITLSGDLDEDQRKRLLEIADRCPVHQSLERSNHIDTKLA